MSSYLLEDVTQLVPDFCKVRNLALRELLYSDRRFSRICEEIDSSKSLALIKEICPSELTKYYLRLKFEKEVNEQILSNCIQLRELTLVDCEEICNLPLTLKKIQLENCEINKNFSYLRKLTWMVINYSSYRNPTLPIFPINLKRLSLMNVSCVIDMNLIPNLECFEYLNPLYSPRNTLIFVNSEYHALQEFVLGYKCDIKNFKFRDLYMFRTRFLEVFDSIDCEFIDEMEIPRNISPTNEIFTKFVNLRKLILGPESRNCYPDFIYPLFNFHGVFPKLEVLENKERRHCTMGFKKLSFNRKLKEISTRLTNINENIVADKFYLFEVMRETSKLEFPIYENFITVDGEIHIYYEKSKFSGKDFEIVAIYSRNGNLEIDNKFPDLFKVNFENNIFKIEKI